MLKIDRKKEYTLDEIAQMLQVDVSTIRTWRDIGLFNADKTEAYLLKTHNKDKNIVIGRDLIEFLAKANWQGNSNTMPK